MGRTLGGVPIINDEIFNYTPGMDITTLQIPRSTEADFIRLCNLRMSGSLQNVDQRH